LTGQYPYLTALPCTLVDRTLGRERSRRQAQRALGGDGSKINSVMK
jgi:hypothetical protein